MRKMAYQLASIQGSVLQTAVHHIGCLRYKALVHSEEANCVVCAQLGQLQDVLGCDRSHLHTFCSLLCDPLLCLVTAESCSEVAMLAYSAVASKTSDVSSQGGHVQAKR